MTTRLLKQAQRDTVAAAIAGVEQRTDAELVTVLAPRSDSYGYIASLWAAALALLTPALPALLSGSNWGAAWSPWQLLALQWLVFVAAALVLRWPPLLYRLVPRQVRYWRAANMARRQFLEQNLHHTAGETGVLIFVSEAEHYVEILADRGISTRVDNGEWQAIVDEFTGQVKRGEVLQGFERCIARCGALLAEHVPATHTRNELPNHLVVLDE